MKKILVIGSLGQIGSELVPELRKKYGKDNVVAAGHKKKPSEDVKNGGPFVFLDATKRETVESVVDEYDVDRFHYFMLCAPLLKFI